MSEGTLNNKNHKDFDAFLKRVLNAYKSDEIDLSSAVGSVMHVVAALDKRNITEVESWINPKNAGFILDAQ